jgi:hypothetical protein
MVVVGAELAATVAVDLLVLKVVTVDLAILGRTLALHTVAVEAAAVITVLEQVVLVVVATVDWVLLTLLRVHQVLAVVVAELVLAADFLVLEDLEQLF